MGYTAADIDSIIAKIRYDLTAAQAKVTDLKTALSTLNLPTEDQRPPCPKCGLRAPRLTEHLENVHGILEEQPTT